MFEKRTSHFCRNEKWRWYGVSLCSSCHIGGKYYKDGKVLHLCLTDDEIKERNRELRKEQQYAIDFK